MQPGQNILHHLAADRAGFMSFAGVEHHFCFPGGGLKATGSSCLALAAQCRHVPPMLLTAAGDLLGDSTR